MRLVDQTSSDAEDVATEGAPRNTTTPAKVRCSCLPACHETNYRGQTTSSPLLSGNLIAYKDYLVNITAVGDKNASRYFRYADAGATLRPHAIIFGVAL